MLSGETEKLEFNQCQKSDKSQYVVYARLECLIEKFDVCKINHEKSSITKVSEHTPSIFSICTILSFKNIENKHYVYRGKDCINKLCESLRKHLMRTINIKKKKNINLLTKQHQEVYKKAKLC